MFSPNLTIGWQGLGGAGMAPAAPTYTSPAASGATYSPASYLTGGRTGNPSKLSIVTRMTPAQYAEYQASAFDSSAQGAADFLASKGISLQSLGLTSGTLGVTQSGPGVKPSGGGGSIFGGLFSSLQSLFSPSTPTPSGGFIAPTQTTAGTYLLYGGLGLLGVALFLKFGPKGKVKRAVRRYSNPVMRPAKKLGKGINYYANAITKPVRRLFR